VTESLTDKQGERQRECEIGGGASWRRRGEKGIVRDNERLSVGTGRELRREELPEEEEEESESLRIHR
jgi:hypothetical protein